MSAHAGKTLTLRSDAFSDGFVKRFWQKERGIFMNKESESLIPASLEITRDYTIWNGGSYVSGD